MVNKKDAIRVSKWNRAHTKNVSLRFNVEEDAEVLKRIAVQPNKTDYVRRLVKKDISKK